MLWPQPVIDDRSMTEPLLRHWPLLGLRVRTPDLELRLPSSEQLAALADLAAEGIHDPEMMPFVVPWTDAPPAERAQSVVLHHWRTLGSWATNDWSLNLTVLNDGQVVGMQQIGGKDFNVVREVGTGSWLGHRHQGHGIGTQMRAAVLHLAFAGLGAGAANSGAFEYNQASRRVSTKLGYEPNGVRTYRIRDQATLEYKYRITRDRWEEHRSVPVTIEGLDGCLELFGAPL